MFCDFRVIWSMLLFFLGLCFTTYGQSDNTAILIISLYTENNITFDGTKVSVQNGKSYSSTIQKYEAYFEVPANHVYRLSIGALKNLYEFRIPDYKNLVYKVVFKVDKSLSPSHVSRLADSIIFDKSSMLQEKAWLGDARVEVYLFDYMGNIYDEIKEIRLIDTVKGNAFVSLSEKEEGIARFLVPKGRTYLIASRDNDSLGMVTVPENAYLVRKNIVYTYALPKDLKNKKKKKENQEEFNYGFVHISLKDNYGNAIPDEIVYFEGKNSGKIYTAVTDKYGNADVALPYGDVYTMHFKYERNVDIFDLSDEALSITDRKVYTTISSAVMESDNKEAKKDYFTQKFNSYVSGKVPFGDSTVLKVLKRNKQWGKKLIVTDLTGSMYPYAGQVLIWYKLNYLKEKKTQLVFFNDGDNKTQEEKRLGRTGGIYICQDCDYMNLFNTMINTILGGNGGDSPENDIEALLVATYNFKKFDELILIADNNSSVRDMALLKKVKYPVHVILCGVEDYVNLEYLKIAYKTGGSVHTIEEDITEIARMLDGETITIGTKTYRLKNGEFVPMD